MADIVLINPAFQMSFWGMEWALPFLGKAANFPPAALGLLAALTPAEHTITLVDENVEPIDWERCARADIVGVTGMNIQRFRMRKILAELKARGKFVVVGGAWVSVQEDYFGDLADVIFVGEAEETWPRFLSEWKAGRHARRYEQAEKTDMTRVPVSRLDLLPMRRYGFGSVQFSRGCPFQCEFCDIIVTFGRRPRLKTVEQVIAELDAHRRMGMRMVFIVDDNLIGNKRAIKPILRAVIDWQHEHGYPISLFTEASIDLADDPELLALLVEANFVAVFVGIESTNEASLRETKKLQNLRPGGTLLEKVHRIQNAGMEVWCGMIVGFDNDDASVFEHQADFLQQARITFAMTGMLTAIPKTPLYDRLAREGPLDLSEPPEFGTNIRPLRMSAATLVAGYRKLLMELYETRAFFERSEALFLDRSFDTGVGKTRYWQRHPLRRLKAEGIRLVQSLGLFLRLMKGVPTAALRREYCRRMWRLLKVHRRPGLLLFYVVRMAMHYHMHTWAEKMAGDEQFMANAF